MRLIEGYKHPRIYDQNILIMLPCCSANGVWAHKWTRRNTYLRILDWTLNQKITMP